MGFYSTTLEQEKPYQKTSDCAQKTASGKFFVSNRNRTYQIERNPLETQQEKLATTTETASGVFFYKYRHYSAELGRWPSRDPIGEKGGINLYGFVENNPTLYFDKLGRNPAVVAIWAYRAINIGVTAYGAAAAWKAATGAADWETLLGKTDPGELSSTNAKGAPKALKIPRKKACPDSGGDIVTNIYNDEWEKGLIWKDSRKLSINVVWSYSNGAINARLDYSASGTNTAVGYAVVGINIQVTSKAYRCQCFKFVACVTGTIQVRNVVDQPWPMDNIDDTTPIRFTVCADGSSS